MVELAAIPLSPAVPGQPGIGTRLLGLTLLERCILTAHRGGIHRIVLLRREGVPIPELHRVHARAPGLEILLPESPGQALPREPFLLLEPRAVFPPDLPERAAREWSEPERPLVLTDPTGAWTGLALAPAGTLPELVRRWQAADPGKPLPELLAQIAGPEPVRQIVPERLPRIVASPTEGARVEAALLASVRKPTDGWVSRHLNRPLSLTLTRLLLRWEVTPNQVSLAGGALGLLSAWLVARGSYATTAAAGLLFQAASVVDGTDGEIAKLTHRASKRGEWIDTTCDIVATAAFLAALPIGIARAGGGCWARLLGWSVWLGLPLLYTLMTGYVRRAGSGGSMLPIVMDLQGGRGPSWLARLGFVVRRDFYALAVMVACLAGTPEVILWVTGLLIPGACLYLIGQLRQPPPESTG